MTDYPIVLEGEIGSFAHGINVGSSDHDYIRIVLEPLDTLLGISAPLDTFRLRPRDEGARSQEGDTETTVYPLRKYVAMAAKGNPNSLPLLWTTNVTVPDTYGLTGIREQFIHKSMAYAHLRFAENLKQCLLGTRAPRVNRPELIEKYGFDTKTASHALRMLIQSCELSELGTMSMPMTAENRAHLIDVRNGLVPLESVLSEVDELTAKLESLIYGLPNTADMSVVNAWLVEVYTRQRDEKRV